MRVRSPIGDLPFTVTGVHRGGAGIVVDGELGAWASHIEIGPSRRADAGTGAARAAGRSRCGRRRRAVPGQPAVSRDVLIGIDQGTSGTRTVAFDLGLRPLADAYRPTEVSHPQPGWIEKDADETVRTVEESLAEVVAAVGADRIAAVGLDNEGETVVAWDAESLAPLAPAVVWGCRRSQPIVDRLAASGDGAEVERISGLPLDPYFSATKIRWLVENVLQVATAADEGRLHAGTLDAYLCARLGGGARTEPSTAGRTQLQALHRPGTWDPDLLRLHGVDEAWLPPIGDSAGDFGDLAGQPLRGLLVDQTASLAGHGCLAEGTAKATYGTGIFLLQNAGQQAPSGLEGVLPIVAWALGGRTTYAIDGGVFSAGTVIGWLRDGIGIIETPAETAALAESVPTPAACGSCRRWPVSGRRGGARTPARRSPGSRRARRGRTWCAPRWTRWRSACGTSLRRCRPGRRRCAWTAG